VGENAEIIGCGNADAGGTMIDAERWMRKGGGVGGQMGDWRLKIED